MKNWQLGGVLACGLLWGCATQPPPTIIVKHDLAPPPNPVIPADPYAALEPQVVNAIEQGKNRAIKIGILTRYPYDPNSSIKVRCLDLHVTQIRLQPGEHASQRDVMWGDPKRWAVMVGDGVVMLEPDGIVHSVVEKPAEQGQGPVIRPPDPKMETNISIHTDMGHWYNLDAVESDRGPYSQAVGWYYPEEVRAQAAARAAALKEVKQ